jgi:hypothetical protein
MKEWLILALLLACFSIQLISWTPTGNAFATMPIFTPVSLQYEQEIRGDGKTLNIREAMAEVERLSRTSAKGTLSSSAIQNLQQTRLRMLDLRNQRHELNIEMMDLAVEIVDELSPPQWAVVQSQRDAIQAKVEMDIFERLLEKVKD